MNVCVCVSCVCALCSIQKSDRMKPIKWNRSGFNWCSLVIGLLGPICIVSRATSLFLYIEAQQDETSEARKEKKEKKRGGCGMREVKEEKRIAGWRKGGM